MSQFKSIAVLPGTSPDASDEVWAIVRRYIDGSWKNYIERFTDRQFDTSTLYDAWFVDCAGWGGGTLDITTTTVQEQIRPTAYVLSSAEALYWFDEDWNYLSSSNQPGSPTITTMDQTDDGTITVVGNLGSSPRVTVYDEDLNADSDYYSDIPGYGASTVMYNNDETLMVALAGGSIYKFNTSDGSLNDSFAVPFAAPNSAAYMAIGDNDNLYFYLSGGNWRYGKYDIDGNFILRSPAPAHGLGGRYLFYDFDNDVLVSTGLTTGFWNVITLNPTTLTVIDSYDDSGDTGGACYYNGHYYVGKEAGSDGYTFIKLDTELNLVAGTNAAGSNAGDTFVDHDGNIATFSVHVLGSTVWRLDPETLAVVGTTSYTGGNFIYREDGMKIPYLQPTDETTETETEGTPGQGCQLEGEIVNILADGVKYPQQIVENCNIDTSVFTNPDTDEVIWGLPVRIQVEPMSIGLTSLAFIPHRNITHAILNLFQSLDCEYGRVEGTYDVIPYSYSSYDSGPDLYSGVKRLPFDGNYAQSGDVIIWSDGNLPFTIRGLAVYYGTEDMKEQLVNTVKKLGFESARTSGPEINLGGERSRGKSPTPAIHEQLPADQRVREGGFLGRFPRPLREYD